MKKNKKPELLAPIQDYTSLTAAIKNGADAVFFGIKGFNMRAGAKNFTLNDLPKVVKIAHKNNVKTYLAINIIIYEEEIKKVEQVLRKVKKAKVDAIICWDFSVIQIAKKLGIEVHISTQASISNSQSAEFYRKLGASRVVLARECTLEQIKKIRKKTKVEIEIFIHGAMCVSVSGRCFMSQFLYGKSANRGECQQPCRRKYIIKQIDGGKELELGEDYVLSPKDMCTMEFIDKVLDLNVDCLKIEGRNRSPEYVATVTKAYRTIIDFIYSHNKKDKNYKKQLEELKDQMMKKLETVYHRGESSGFFFGKPVDAWSKSYGNQATLRKVRIGKVIKFYDKINVAEIIMQDNESIEVGDSLIFQGPTTGSYEFQISSMEKDHKQINKAVQGENIAIKTEEKVRKNDEVFVVRKAGCGGSCNGCQFN
jgi:putative protease